MSARSAAQKRAGFTLIELMIVVLILAAIAAMLIPRLGFMEDRAQNATAASTAAQLVNNLEQYKVSAGSYPLGMDSLYETGDGPLYTKLWSHTAGGFTSGPGGAFEKIAFPSGYSQSFGHAFLPGPDGQYYAYDHSPAVTDYTNSATVKRPFTTITGTNFVFVKDTGAGSSLYRSLGYTNGSVPAGVKLLVFGIGPNTGSSGETMISAPRHTEQGQEYYGRFFAVFALYASGKPAELKGVLDSYASSVDSNLSSYAAGASSHD